MDDQHTYDVRRVRASSRSFGVSFDGGIISAYGAYVVRRDRVLWSVSCSSGIIYDAKCVGVYCIYGVRYVVSKISSSKVLSNVGKYD